MVGETNGQTVKTAPARGRIVASRYLSTSTASSRNHAAANASTSKTGASSAAKTPNTASTKGKTVTRLGSSKGSTVTPSTLKKSTRVAPSTSNASKTSSSAVSPPVPSKTTDDLQIAAQALPWLYMTSSLKSCFKSAEVAAQDALDGRAKELAAEEADIAEQRVRFEAERVIAFYEELAMDNLSQVVPAAFQAYLRHGSACTQITATALHLATQDTSARDVSIQPYNETLSGLREAQAEARRIEDALTELLKAPPIHVPSIPDVLRACLAVLRSRTCSLSSAHDLVQTLKQNTSLKLHLDSLRLPS